MAIIYGFLILVEAVVSALLIGVIFLQKTKGGMGGSAFGGGMGEAIFGSRMGNVLTKVTVVLGVIFLVNTILLTMLTARRGTVSSVTDLGRIEQPAPVAPSPGPIASEDLPPLPMPVAIPSTDEAAGNTPIALAPIEIPAPITVDSPAPVASPEAAVEVPEVPATPAE